MRIIAILASYNEARFIQHVIRHLGRHGIESYLIDNESTDGTLELARACESDGLVGWEVLPRQGIFAWSEVLQAKQQVAARLPADWFIHQDCDEFRLPPPGYDRLADAITDMDRQGYNAIHFDEFTFQPVLEAPDHDHDRFLETMRWYYPFSPFPLHRLNAWKASVGAVDLRQSGGHQVQFPGRHIAPLHFRMRHYMMLSRAQAIIKYQRTCDQKSIEQGWHGWRAHPPSGTLLLPPAHALYTYRDDEHLRAEAPPLAKHILAELWEGRRPAFPRRPGWAWEIRFRASQVWPAFG